MSSSAILICSEKTKDGKPCRGRAMKGKTLCVIHYKASIGEPITRKRRAKSPSATKSPRNVPSSLPDYILEISESTKAPKHTKSAFMASVNMETEEVSSVVKPVKRESPPYIKPVNREEPPCIKGVDVITNTKIIVDAKSPKRKTVKSMSEMRRLMSPRRKRIGLK